MFATQVIQDFLNRVEDVDPASTPPANASFLDIAESWRTSAIRPGDVILFCLPNGKILLEHFFAAMAAGAVPALVGPSTPSARLKELIAALNPAAILSLRPMPADLGASPSQNIGGARVSRFIPEVPAAAQGEVILLTSGTSGFASGCVHDFNSLILNAERHAQSIAQRIDDAILVSLPLYFSYALVAQALASLVRGNRLIIGGPPFHVPTYLNSLSRFGVTISSLTPVLIGSLLQSGASLPNELRVLTVGGDSLAPATVEELIRRRPDQELYLTYGLTQCGPRVSTLAAHAEPKARYSSVGLPLAGTSVRLEEVPGSAGLTQLFVSSATIMKRRIGIHEIGPHNGSPCAETVATGDIFTQDEQGYLYFRGRLSDYIVRHGEKVCLAAVRRVAMRFPNVLRATTPVSKHDYGEDFDLVLDITGVEANYDVLLRSWLRRSEMPRAIRVVNRQDSQLAAYK